MDRDMHGYSASETVYEIHKISQKTYRIRLVRVANNERGRKGCNRVVSGD
jgi:hypothetical protein